MTFQNCQNAGDSSCDSYNCNCQKVREIKCEILLKCQNVQENEKGKLSTIKKFEWI